MTYNDDDVEDMMEEAQDKVFRRLVYPMRDSMIDARRALSEITEKIEREARLDGYNIDHVPEIQPARIALADLGAWIARLQDDACDRKRPHHKESNDGQRTTASFEVCTRLSGLALTRT